MHIKNMDKKAETKTMLSRKRRKGIRKGFIDKGETKVVIPIQVEAIELFMQLQYLMVIFFEKFLTCKVHKYVKLLFVYFSIKSVKDVKISCFGVKLLFWCKIVVLV